MNGFLRLLWHFLKVNMAMGNKLPATVSAWDQRVVLRQGKPIICHLHLYCHNEHYVR